MSSPTASTATCFTPLRRRVAQGFVEITPTASGSFRIRLEPSGPVALVERTECETTFPVELVDEFIRNSPFVSLCTWISRHEEKEVGEVIRRQLLSYCRPADFEGKRLLDFGCGSGASAFSIAPALPNTEIVGVDLSPERIAVAQEIACTYRIQNVRFLVSPAADRLPDGIGTFDFVTLNAVYEHLLPGERRELMPLLWRHLNVSGILFVNQTPYRYFPYEHHSTRLWFINYLPDRAAHWFARRFARLNPGLNRSGTWNELLRGGIRGGTEAEIRRNLCARGGRASILQPCSTGDRGAYWLACTSAERHRAIKRTVAGLFSMSDRLLGTVPSMNLDVAFRKDA
jgi:ubiquinone/menaquinone biosynthesis C-methylase UbiE